MDEKKYVKERKRLLNEMKELQYRRQQLARQIRKLQDDMNNWDKVLLNGD